MHVRLFQVDAFADTLFAGNPAAICPLDHWLEDSMLQRIALENNLSETADFPQDNLHPVPMDHPSVKLFGQKVLEIHRGNTDFLLVVESEEAVRNVIPELQKLAQFEGRGFIVTAPGSDVDYVSRCFYPQSGVYEDPATGSSHTTLTPYWAEKLGKKKLTARQLSSRGAHFETEWVQDRVMITGKAVSYLEGVITV